MNAPITLLDAYGLIYRSYFAFIRNPLLDSKGQNVSVLYGFFNTLRSFLTPPHGLLSGTPEPRFAVVFDSKTPTFRHQHYPAYKANRDKTPDDLHAQIPQVEAILKALEIPVLQQDGVEADDILATLAVQCSQRRLPCRLITGDKDLLQLVDDWVTVFKPEKGQYTPMDRESVRFFWGVGPERILDYLSLTGDSADNVPGVPGIGEKTAQKLLSEFDSLEAIYEGLDSVAPSIRKKLEAGREKAALSKTLITLKTDLNFSPDDISPRPIVWSRAVPLFLQAELKSLAGEKGTAAQPPPHPSTGTASVPGLPHPPETAADKTAPGTTPAADTAAPDKSPAADTASPGTTPPDSPAPPEGPGSIWSDSFHSPWGRELQETEWECLQTLSDVETKLTEAARAGQVAFDCETDSLAALNSKVLGFSFCFCEQKAFYVPLYCQGNEVLPNQQVKALLRRFFATPGLQIIGHNYTFDYKALSHWGVDPCPAWADTMIAAWLVDSDWAHYSLDSLADRTLGYRTIRFSDIVPKKETFETLPLSSAAPYAAEDALITLRLWKALSTFLKKGQLTNLFFSLEMKIAFILTRMECSGIRCDPALLSVFGRQLAEQLTEIEAEVYRACGHSFNLNSPKQLQEVLFNELKLPPGKKTQTGYSTDTAVLQSLAAKHRVPLLLLRNRSLAKLKSTYTDTLPLLVNPETGRIHTHFLQTGTATGRLSSRDPNLQNIPVKEEEGRMIRKAFCAEEGRLFLSADYSQIELAVLASLSGDEHLCEAFRSQKDIHRHTASLIFAKAEADITPQERRIAKTINFGVIYGMSAFRLSRELQIPMERAQNFIAAYFATYPGISDFIRQTVSFAKAHGYVQTEGGHVRRINGINSRNKTEEAGARRVAVNTVIQGTAAEIVKRAMIALDGRLRSSDLHAVLLLQIHDELLYELPEDEVSPFAAWVEAEMKAAARLRVPVSVAVETGKSWGDFH